MAKSAEPTEVTPGKVRALREHLLEHGQVTFASGVTAKLQAGESVQMIRRFGKVRIERHFSMRKLEAAYDYAVNGDRRPPPPREPFWWDSKKLRKHRPEWEECPF